MTTNANPNLPEDALPMDQLKPGMTFRFPHRDKHLHTVLQVTAYAVYTDHGSFRMNRAGSVRLTDK